MYAPAVSNINKKTAVRPGRGVRCDRGGNRAGEIHPLVHLFVDSLVDPLCRLLVRPLVQPWGFTRSGLNALPTSAVTTSTLLHVNEEKNLTLLDTIVQNDCMIDSRLRLLQMVERTGTVTGAAHALHYTPSAASYQLRQLGKEHNVRLIEPYGRGIRLTASAHILLRHTTVLAAQAERARAELAAANDEPGGAFTLCGFSTAATHLLPPVAASLRDDQPQVQVRVIEAEPDRCLELLMTGDADIALVVATSEAPSESDARFEQQAVFDDPLDLIVPSDHPFTRRQRVTLSDARGESWILGRPDSTYHHLVDAACESAGFSPNVAHYADEWDTGTALVARHFGIILVPRLARFPNHLPVVRIPLHGDPAPARRIISVTRRGSSAHPLVTSVLNDIDRAVAHLFPEM